MRKKLAGVAPGGILLCDRAICPCKALHRSHCGCLPDRSHTPLEGDCRPGPGFLIFRKDRANVKPHSIYVKLSGAGCSDRTSRCTPCDKSPGLTPRCTSRNSSKRLCTSVGASSSSTSKFRRYLPRGCLPSLGGAGCPPLDHCERHFNVQINHSCRVVPKSLSTSPKSFSKRVLSPGVQSPGKGSQRSCSPGCSPRPVSQRCSKVLPEVLGCGPCCPCKALLPQRKPSPRKWEPPNAEQLKAWQEAKARARSPSSGHKDLEVWGCGPILPSQKKSLHCPRGLHQKKKDFHPDCQESHQYRVPHMIDNNDLYLPGPRCLSAASPDHNDLYLPNSRICSPAPSYCRTTAEFSPAAASERDGLFSRCQRPLSPSTVGASSGYSPSSPSFTRCSSPSSPSSIYVAETPKTRCNLYIPCKDCHCHKLQNTLNSCTYPQPCCSATSCHDCVCHQRAQSPSSGGSRSPAAISSGSPMSIVSIKPPRKSWDKDPNFDFPFVRESPYSPKSPMSSQSTKYSCQSPLYIVDSPRSSQYSSSPSKKQCLSPISNCTLSPAEWSSPQCRDCECHKESEGLGTLARFPCSKSDESKGSPCSSSMAASRSPCPSSPLGLPNPPNAYIGPYLQLPFAEELLPKSCQDCKLDHILSKATDCSISPQCHRQMDRATSPHLTSVSPSCTPSPVSIHIKATDGFSPQDAYPTPQCVDCQCHKFFKSPPPISACKAPRQCPVLVESTHSHSPKCAQNGGQYCPSNPCISVVELTCQSGQSSPQATSSLLCIESECYRPQSNCSSKPRACQDLATEKIRPPGKGLLTDSPVNSKLGLRIAKLESPLAHSILKPSTLPYLGPGPHNCCCGTCSAVNSCNIQKICPYCSHSHSCCCGFCPCPNPCCSKSPKHRSLSPTTREVSFKLSPTPTTRPRQSSRSPSPKVLRDHLKTCSSPQSSKLVSSQPLCPRSNSPSPLRQRCNLPDSSACHQESSTTRRTMSPCSRNARPLCPPVGQSRAPINCCCNKCLDGSPCCVRR